jgi:parallel beta-helix repeat protein
MYNNKVETNDMNGIFLEEFSNSNTIDNNNCSYNLDNGIMIKSDYNVIKRNKCHYNRWEGIMFYSSFENKILSNYFSNNINAIRLEYSDDCIIKNNSMLQCGLYFFDDEETWGTQNIDINNTVNNKPVYYLKNRSNYTIPSNAGQIILYSCSNITINNQNVSRGSEGISIWGSKNILIKNTFSSENSHNGIRLYNSANCIIQNVTCNNNKGLGRPFWYGEGGNGICFIHSNFNKILNCNFIGNNKSGIDMYWATSNVVENCFFQNNSDGISMAASWNIKLKNNRMTNCGIVLAEGDLYHFNSHKIGITNTVNGKPVYYWVNQKNQQLPAGAGQAILVNCSKIIIKDQDLSNGSIGITSYFSDNLTIDDNFLNDNNYGIFSVIMNDSVISNNHINKNKFDGIYLGFSCGNSIRSNTLIQNFMHGIFLDASTLNEIENNTISNNNIGIEFMGYGESMMGFHDKRSPRSSRSELPRYASFNSIINNTISENYYAIQIIVSNCNEFYFNNINDNQYGISLFGDKYNEPAGNVFYWNNIIDNDVQAQDCYYTGWSLRGQGNYWSDYKGKDNGAYYREKGDGIGDTQIPHLGLDFFPLMNPINFTIPPKSPILIDPGELDSDGNYTISWSDSPRATGYILEESTTPGFESVHIVYNGSKHQIGFQRKDNGTYYYRVRAYNQHGVSKWSNIVDITIDWLPNIPKGLVIYVYPEGNALNLSWDLNSKDTKFYEIFSNYTGNWTKLIKLRDYQASFNHSNLIDGREYFYKIRSIDSIGQNSNFSTIRSGIPADSVPPIPPIGLKIALTTENITYLEWQPNTEDDLEGYNIYRSKKQNPRSWGKPIGSVGSGIEQYMDLDLEETTTYFYVITAFDEVPNESGLSNIVWGTTTMDQYGPEINNSVKDFTILEDHIDDSSINLFKWFKDKNNDPMVFSCNGSKYIKVYIFQSNGTVILIPKKDWSGQETLTFTASDGIFNVSDDVTITVIPVNDPPGPAVITKPINDYKTKIGTPLNFLAICLDPDIPYGDELSYFWYSNISDVFGERQNLSNIVLPVGFHQITVYVFDLADEYCSNSINITIFSVSTEPENVTPGPNQTNPELPPKFNTTKPKKDEQDKISSEIVNGTIIVIIAIVILLVFILIVTKKDIHPIRELKNIMFRSKKDHENNSEPKPPPDG